MGVEQRKKTSLASCRNKEPLWFLHEGQLPQGQFNPAIRKENREIETKTERDNKTKTKRKTTVSACRAEVAWWEFNHGCPEIPSSIKPQQLLASYFLSKSTSCSLSLYHFPYFWLKYTFESLKMLLSQWNVTVISISIYNTQSHTNTHALSHTIRF